MSSLLISMLFQLVVLTPRRREKNIQGTLSRTDLPLAWIECWPRKVDTKQLTEVATRLCLVQLLRLRCDPRHCVKPRNKR